MRRRQSIAFLFVLVMVGLGAAVVLHWRSAQPKRLSYDPTVTIDWRPATDKEYAAAKSTVNGQLSAFKADNFQQAALYQSQMLRLAFYTVEHFRDVIRTRYPAFVHYDTVEFGQCVSDADGDRIRLEVTLIGKDHSRVRAAYYLHSEGGAYHVAQVSVGEGEDGGFVRRPGIAGLYFPPGARMPSHGPLHSPPPPDSPPDPHYTAH